SDYLSKNNISIKNDNTPTPIPQFMLPKIVGASIAHHFYNITNQQAKPISQLAREFSKSSIPEAPNRGQWQFRAGCTKYYNDKNNQLNIQMKRVYVLTSKQWLETVIFL
ncbi:6566_t:CDS:1, partial [Paraglomus brasilianum]